MVFKQKIKRFYYFDLCKILLYCTMHRLTIDRTKLIRFTTYAKKKGLTRQAIYAQEKSGAIEVIEIDGVKFVYIA